MRNCLKEVVQYDYLNILGYNLPQTTKVLNRQEKTSLLDKFIEVDAMMDTIGMHRPNSHNGELLPEFYSLHNKGVRIRAKEAVNFVHRKP